jgi:hypothetical protein
MVGGTWALRPRNSRSTSRNGTSLMLASRRRITLRIELPLLAFVRPIPITGIIVPFVVEADGDAVFVERPELLDQPVFMLAGPFALQEFDDRDAPLDGGRAMEAPRCVRIVPSS